MFVYISHSMKYLKCAGVHYGHPTKAHSQNRAGQLRIDKIYRQKDDKYFNRLTGQNGSGQNGMDKMVWTKWY